MMQHPIPHRDTGKRSMHDSRLASAVFMQYERGKGQIIKHLII